MTCSLHIVKVLVHFPRAHISQISLLHIHCDHVQTPKSHMPPLTFHYDFSCCFTISLTRHEEYLPSSSEGEDLIVVNIFPSVSFPFDL